jgi:hypothetical protein
LSLDLGHQTAVLRFQRIEPLAHHRVGFGIELAKSQVLQLLTHFVHAHATGERRINIERLLGTAPARLRRHVGQRAHVMQPVGELDQQHPNVVGNGQQEPAQVLGLLRLLGDKVELLELGETFDQAADVAAEHLVDLCPGRGRILDGVMQQRRGDGGIIELEIGEDRRDFERMRKIGVTRGSFLLAVRLHGVHISAVEKRLARIRIIAFHALDQIVLPHHLRLQR